MNGYTVEVCVLWITCRGGQGRGGLSLRQRGTPLGRMSLLVLLSQAAKSQRCRQLLAREPRLLPLPSLPGPFLS